MYYFRCDRPDGFGLQGLYSATGEAEAVFVKHGTVVGIPGGYHPVCAAPGTHLYYLWALAGVRAAARDVRGSRAPLAARRLTVSLASGALVAAVGNCDQRREVAVTSGPWAVMRICVSGTARGGLQRGKRAVQSCAIRNPGWSVALPAVRDTVAVVDLA